MALRFGVWPALPVSDMGETYALLGKLSQFWDVLGVAVGAKKQ